MRLTWLLVTVLAGCRFTLPSVHTCERNEECRPGGACQPNGFCSRADPNCPAGQVYDTYSGDLSGVCVGAEPNPEAGVIDTSGGPVCYGAANGLVKPCFSVAPTGELLLQGPLDTDASGLCATPLSGGINYCVIAANTIQITDSLAVSGSKPLLLVANTSIKIEAGATLDVASHQGPISKIGPGAGSPACTVGTPPTVSGGAGGGGAGGTFAGAGGTGGAGGGQGGVPGSVQTATILRGGCRGQNGINGTFGTGGNGGGVVYLIANSSITIAGAINASGEGGHPGVTGSAGGGGGGSGGMIGLDAPTIINTGAVFANGASGGEGSGTMTTGNLGPEPTGVAASPRPPSNTALGGDGGGGSAGTINAAGENGAAGTSGGGGGGGGGGIGVIKVFGGGTLTGMRSPPPS